MIFHEQSAVIAMSQDPYFDLKANAVDGTCAFACHDSQFEPKLQQMRQMQHMFFLPHFVAFASNFAKVWASILDAARPHSAANPTQRSRCLPKIYKFFEDGSGLPGCRLDLTLLYFAHAMIFRIECITKICINFSVNYDIFYTGTYDISVHLTSFDLF